MNRIILILLPLLAPALSCKRGQILSGEARSEAYACFDKAGCTNPIDYVVNDAFTCRLTPVSEATPKELCRRLFADTIGRLPTDEDFAAHCDGKTLDATLDDLFAMPEYILERQKLWANRVGYNDARTWYFDLISFDLLVADLYRGDVRIEDFLVTAAIHPAVLTSADDTLTAFVERSASPRINATTLSKGPSADAYVERVFQTLLLRSPTAIEYAEFPNLYRQFEIDPLAHDPDPALAGFDTRMLRIAPCNCAGAKRAACQTSAAVGVHDVSLPLPFPAAADCSAEPGNAYYYRELVDNKDPKKDFSTARDILKIPGTALSQRAFIAKDTTNDTPAVYGPYQAYAKEALDRLLGYDVVEALGSPLGDDLLAAVATNFASDGNIRNLEANIFRSVFYRQAQMPPATSPPVDCNGKPSPLYAGPRKRFDAEHVIGSMMTAAGAALGKCDHRLQGRLYSRQNGGADAYAPPAPVFYYDAEPSGAPNVTFRTIAQTVDACVDNVNQQRTLDDGAFTQMGLDRLSRMACETGTKILPPSPDTTSDQGLGAIVDYQFTRFFLDPPSADEKAAGIAAMKSCMASSQTCTAMTVAQRFCSALLKSSRYLTY